MRELDATTAAAYLRDVGWLPPGEVVDVRELAGGVSNIVLLVRRDQNPDFVLKQARERLRVAEPWFCGVERIWREADVLRICRSLLDRVPADGGWQIGVPRILNEDRANYVFAMEAAAPTHQVWKSQLLAGVCDPAVAEAAGRLLAGLHAHSWRDGELASQLEDRQFFEQLRVDPYYRHLARHAPALHPAIDRLIDSLQQHRCGLVHGDFSPKNLLLDTVRTRHKSAETVPESDCSLMENERLWLVDCEVGHYGDVAFDVGFFLSHLVLKTFRAGEQWPAMLALIQRFWTAYRGGLGRQLSDLEIRGVESRGMEHLAGCGLARLDGKSPVEYLTDAGLRDRLRKMFRAMLREPPVSWTSWEPQLRSHL
jgi:5-methylthioribose kinase